MDRRDFLKILGIGGVALTLPKPIGIISAKMADLQGPPLHVGYCEIGPLANDQRAFMWDRLMVGLEHTLSIERYKDWSERWIFTMFLRRKKDDPDSRIMFMKVRANYLPIPMGDRFVVLRDPGEGQVPWTTPHECRMHERHMWSPDEVAEFWFTPASSSDLPRFPLPKLNIGLNGLMIYKKEMQSTGRDYVMGGRTLHYSAFGEVRTVQLDRARAISMGLVSPEEPEGIIT